MTTTRFAISQHTGGPAGDHYDLFLEAQGSLKTWRLLMPDFLTSQAAKRIEDHRLTYLDFEGAISGERGKVALWDRGEYAIDLWKPDRLQVALRGKKLQSRVRLTADPKKAPDAWTAADPTPALRQAIASFLRTVQMEPAPEPDLDEIGAALMKEEQRIVVEIDRFTKAKDVDWDSVATDETLREKLKSAHSRWRHPWLAQADKFASGLDAIVKLMRP